MALATIGSKLKLGGMVLCWTLTASVAASANPGYPLQFGQIVIEQAWARLEPAAEGTVGKVYLTIHNKSDADDYLLAVDSPASRSSMIHESSQQPVPGGLTIASHGEVVMRPDGFHIALTGVSPQSASGKQLPVRVVMRDAGSFDLTVPILVQSEGDPAVEHSGHGP